MKKISAVFAIILLSLILILIFLKYNYVVPILMYHSIDTEEAEVSNLAISEDLFAKQMHYLVQNGYHSLTIEDFVYLKRNKKVIPAKSVVITFDDGLENNFTKAYPILKKYNICASISVAVDNLGKTIDNHYFKNAKFMSWQQVKELSEDKQIIIGSHSLHHRYMPELKAADLRVEIFRSKEILQTKLNKKVDFFCYPIGGFNKNIQHLLKEAGYTAALTTNRGYQKTCKNEDLYALKRIKINKRDNIFKFGLKVSGYYSLFSKVVNPE